MFKVAAAIALTLAAWRVALPALSRGGDEARGDPTRALERQAELVQKSESLRNQKPEEAIVLLTEALKIEADLFPVPTHTGLYLRDRLYWLYAGRTGGPTSRRRDPAAAARSTREAVAIQAAFLGDPPLDVGEKGDARALAGRFQAAVKVREKVFGEKHRWVGLTLIDLALAEEAGGHPKQAKADLERADRLLTHRGALASVFAPDARYHLDRLAGAAARPDAFVKRLERVAALAQKAREAEQQGNVPAARSVWIEAVGHFAGFYGSEFAAGEAEQLRMAQEFRRFLDEFLSFAARHGLPDADAQRLYRGVSHIKGGVFLHQYRLRRERHHATLQPFFNVHEELTRRVAGLLAGKGTPEGPTAAEARRLGLRLALVEAEMARRFDAMPWSWNPPLVPRGAVIVDYYVYVRPAPVGPPERCLACFVRRSGQAPPLKDSIAHRDLGSLAPIETAIIGWREQITGKGGGSDPTIRGELRKRIWQPIAPLLGGAGVVLISPDGMLSAVPFAALPSAKPGTYLAEEVATAVLPIPQLFEPMPSHTAFLASRDASPTAPPPEVAAAPLLVGGVDFSVELPRAKGQNPAIPEFTFKPLPGTEKEVKEIDALFRTLKPGKVPDVLTGGSATESAFRARAGKYRWLHLATHGYFLPEAAAGGRPELQSAVAFAGANTGGAGPKDDGLLTALEAGSLDLGGVDLATLSACETSLGSTAEGEGVLGLQRAFQLAGARSTITSLWSVDDEATRVLMERFYRQLWGDGGAKLEALRQVQLWMLREGKSNAGIGRGLRKVGVPQPADDGRLPPYYWAAFVLSGDWR